MPTIKDAERVFHLANERYLLQRVDVMQLEVSVSDTPYGPFTIKHIGPELIDLLRRERDLQVAAIEKEIRALGFTLDDAKPVEPPALHVVERDNVW